MLIIPSNIRLKSIHFFLYRIDPSESLFNNFSYILSQDVNDTLDPLKRYCVCEKEQISTDPLNLTCSLTTEFCSSNTENVINAFSSICSSNIRNRRSSGLMHKIHRRSTTDSDDVTEFEPLTYNEDVVNTEIPVSIVYHCTDCTLY